MEFKKCEYCNDSFAIDKIRAHRKICDSRQNHEVSKNIEKVDINEFTKSINLVLKLNSNHQVCCKFCNKQIKLKQYLSHLLKKHSTESLLIQTIKCPKCNRKIKPALFRSHIKWHLYPKNLDPALVAARKIREQRKSPMRDDDWEWKFKRKDRIKSVIYTPMGNKK